MNPPHESADLLDPCFADRMLTYISEDVVDADEAIEPGTDLLLTGLVDSLGVVMIVEWLERELDTTIDPGDVVLEHFHSIDAILAYLRVR